MLFAATAGAQTTTAGAIQGTVSDESTGGPMLLVTVVASSPALQGTQSEFTDASGQYFMSNLPPGSYSLLFIYGDTKVKRDNIDVGVGKVTVANAKINTSATGEVITIVEKAPTIDAGSSKQGVTIAQDYMKNIPSRGRTWAAVASAAGGSQDDFGLGTSFSGSGSLENNYVVDGLNTTGVTLGQGFPTQGSQVLNNFIQEIEVITGGYNAEFGRSTGGVVNVVTKTGSNEFHGSVFANVNPFNASADTVPKLGSALSQEANLPTQFDFGFDIGGPIIKDKLWFYVGFAPVLTRQTVNRVVSTQVDRGINGFNYRDANCTKNFDGTCDGDGNVNTTSARGCELHRAGEQGACEGDGTPDLDPATNHTAFEKVGSHGFDQNVNTYQFTAKLNFAVTPEHQGQISFTGQPNTARVVLALNGTPSATQEDETEIPTDLSFKWTSKFFDNKTQVDAILGWHRNRLTADPITSSLPNDPTLNPKNIPLQRLGSAAGNLPLLGKSTLGFVGRNRDQNEDASVLQFCTDGTDQDQFAKIPNCPVGGRYLTESPGFITDSTEQRYAAKLTVTERVKALGHHQFKAGVDFESNVLDDTRGLYGGERDTYTTSGGAAWDIFRYVKLNPSGSDVCGFTGANGDVPLPCDYLANVPVHGNTYNIGAFLQDSWSILPNLTINAGVRYEQQRLAWKEDARGTLDPALGQSIGTYALELTDLIAPRIGLIFDWTKEGRSKIYANWGRFYESIPMDINNRSFGGEVTLDQLWDAHTGADCGGMSTDPLDAALASQVRNCPKKITVDQSGLAQSLVGASTAPDTDPHSYGLPPTEGEMIIPKTHAQYLDEFVLGVEYEVLEDLRVGASYQNRRLGRVIEDMSSDGAATYFIGNPGEFDSDAENDLLNLIKSHMGDADQTVRQQLINRLNAFRAAKRFDKPQRAYNALQLTASKRFSRNFMIQASYTYSQEKGNYPGLFSPDHAQLDPNITAQFDLFDMAANRFGSLSYDRPHIMKLDGYYTFDLKEAGRLTAGARFRAQSGIPYTPLGAAPQSQYGILESYILPRGTGGRTSFQANADLHLAYARKLGSNLDLELYFELYNVFNNQEQATVDQDYTDDLVAPIVGGTSKDLPYLKPVAWSAAQGGNGSFGGANGVDPNSAIHPAVKNLNYGNASALVSPLSGRFGATLSF